LIQTEFVLISTRYHQFDKSFSNKVNNVTRFLFAFRREVIKSVLSSGIAIVIAARLIYYVFVEESLQLLSQELDSAIRDWSKVMRHLGSLISGF
jgi:hypothetical protein